MDYKYIEQLMERYWNCETTLEEEQILRTFFAQVEIPVHLLKYKSLFTYQRMQHQAECLGDDFDEKVLAAIHAPVVKAERLTLMSRFSGLFKAAAAVAILCLLGGVGQQMVSTSNKGTVAGYETMEGKDDPQIASQPVSADKHVSMADSINSIKASTEKLGKKEVVTE